MLAIYTEMNRNGNLHSFYIQLCVNLKLICIAFCQKCSNYAANCFESPTKLCPVDHTVKL